MNWKHLPFIAMCGLVTAAAAHLPPPGPEPPRKPLSKAQAREVDALFAVLDAHYAEIPLGARWGNLGDSVSIKASDGSGSLVMYSVGGSDALGIIAGPALPCLSQSPEMLRVGGRPMRLVHACVNDEHVATPSTVTARNALMNRLASLDSVTIANPGGASMRFDLRGFAHARRTLQALREFDRRKRSAPRQDAPYTPVT